MVLQWLRELSRIKSYLVCYFLLVGVKYIMWCITDQNREDSSFIIAGHLPCLAGYTSPPFGTAEKLLIQSYTSLCHTSLRCVSNS